MSEILNPSLGVGGGMEPGNGREVEPENENKVNRKVAEILVVSDLMMELIDVEINKEIVDWEKINNLATIWNDGTRLTITLLGNKDDDPILANNILYWLKNIMVNELEKEEIDSKINELLDEARDDGNELGDLWSSWIHDNLAQSTSVIGIKSMMALKFVNERSGDSNPELVLKNESELKLSISEVVSKNLTDMRNLLIQGIKEEEVIENLENVFNNEFVIEMWKLNKVGRNGKCYFNLDSELGHIKVKVYKLLMSRLLRNIYNNAMEARADTLRVTAREISIVENKQEGDVKTIVEFVFVDNGSGFSKERLEKGFRLGESQKIGASKGSGAGMYYLSQKVLELGGEILISNVEKLGYVVGGRVKVRLPIFEDVS